MNSILQDTAAVCIVLAAAGLAGRLCPENSMVRFVQAMAALVLLVSAVLPLFTLEWEFSQPMQKAEETGEELSGYILEQTEEAAGAQMENYIEGLLAAAGLKAEKIEAFTDIGEDSRIVCTKVSAAFAYESDSERALALLENVLGDSIKVEVWTDGR